MGECVFEPLSPLCVDSFKNCEGLSRIAFLDGNTCVMIGKVMSTQMGAIKNPMKRKIKGKLK